MYISCACREKHSDELRRRKITEDKEEGFMCKNERRVLPRLTVGLAVAAMLTALFCPFWAFAGGDVLVGDWVTPNNDRIRIFKQGDRFFGKPAPYPWQKPRKDVNNPDPGLRNRSLAEALILENFRFEGGKWIEGTAYDPDNGKTYRCEIRPQGDREIALRGYVGVPLFGRTEVWRREGAF